MTPRRPVAALEALPISDLVEHRAALDAGTSMAEAQAWFRTHPWQHAAVLERDQFTGMLGRNQLHDALGGPFGFALHGRLPVGQLPRESGLVAYPDWPLHTLLKAMLSRTHDFHDDVPLVTDEGHYLGCFTVARVVAAQSELLEQHIGLLLNQSRDLRALERRIAQEEKEALLARLLGGVAHEMNNKLTPIKGFSELLARGLERGHAPAELLGHCRTITEGVDEATTLLRQLLNISRPPALHPQRQDFRPLVNDALALVQFRARACQVTCRCELPESPVPVLADGPQIRQVLVNLMLNALDAMEAAPRRELSVSLEEAGSDLVLVLEDTGHGIHPDHHEQVFEPFFSTKSPDKGTGLGLSISRTLIHQHHGTQTFQSRPGEGTRFEIRLPRHASS